MRKHSLLILFILLWTTLNSQTLNKVYLQYIEKYYQLAQTQQKEFGIPASITLAQGLLESSAGMGELALKSNNHFGIKCKDWTGEKVYHDDDLKGECFRKYNEVVESYKDHSLFLKTRKHYAFLFDLKQTDYKGWAYGLKKAGYATDPSYPTKLITLIENYNLHRFDLGETIDDSKDTEQKSTENKEIGKIGTIKANTPHEIFRVNGVKFVTSINGDTYGSISEEFNLKESKLRAYNDVSDDEILKAGTRVFIAKKKSKAPEGYESHRVREGESMRSISQDYAIKVVELYKINSMNFADSAKLDQIIKLR